MPDDERDDETIFWERFFEKLQPLREAGQKVTGSVDASPIGDASTEPVTFCPASLRGCNFSKKRSQKIVSSSRSSSGTMCVPPPRPHEAIARALGGKQVQHQFSENWLTVVTLCCPSRTRRRAAILITNGT